MHVHILHAQVVDLLSSFIVPMMSSTPTHQHESGSAEFMDGNQAKSYTSSPSLTVRADTYAEQGGRDSKTNTVDSMSKINEDKQV